MASELPGLTWSKLIAYCEGNLRHLLPAEREALTCVACKISLWHGGRYWVCPRGHGRQIPDRLVLEALRKSAGEMAESCLEGARRRQKIFERSCRPPRRKREKQPLLPMTFYD